MEIQKFISDVLAGKAQIMPFVNVSFAPDKDRVTACILSALNFARLAFAIEKSALVLPKILGLLCSRKTVEVWIVFLSFARSTEFFVTYI
jgi:hypothetical protein